MALNHKVTHVGIGLDKSWSMDHLSDKLVETVDDQILHLAQQSRELNQEVRVSVYSFSGRQQIENLCWDMDVLRFDTIKGLYKVGGRTALLDCTHTILEDFATIPVKYDDHAKIIYMWTDGMENDSVKGSPHVMSQKIESYADDTTVAIFVPDLDAERYAISAGFSKGNIKQWNATSTSGIEDVGKIIRATTTSYLQGRSQGVKSYRGGLFSLNTVSTDQIKKDLKPLSFNQFVIVQHDRSNKSPIWIRDLVQNSLPITYTRGFGYYELVKTEHIRPAQAVVIEQGGNYYAGSARELLGLIDETVKVAPDYNAAYKIFVQSQSHNRNIIPGERVLYLTGNSLSHLPRRS